VLTRIGRKYGTGKEVSIERKELDLNGSVQEGGNFLTYSVATVNDEL
jgi:hypothetical protein